MHKVFRNEQQQHGQQWGTKCSRKYKQGSRFSVPQTAHRKSVDQTVWHVFKQNYKDWEKYKELN